MRRKPTARIAFMVPIALALTGLMPAAVFSQAQELQPSDLIPCPFTPAEIQTAFGVTVEPGAPSFMNFPGGRDVACLYDVINSQAVITVRQTWGTLPGPAASNGVPEVEKERLERAIPGDADGAMWVRDKKEAGAADDRDEKKVKLQYGRAQGRVRTELSFYGLGGEWVAADFRQKLLKLRRVP
jgi:hypothetical protein